MTLAHRVRSGANCVAEPGQLRNFENHSTLSPGQGGYERTGQRPVLVISPADYNGKTSLMLCSPMTSKVKRLSIRGNSNRQPFWCGPCRPSRTA
jgi:hypothetical protein